MTQPNQTYADLDALEAQIAASTVTYPDVSTLIAELRASRRVVEAATALDRALEIDYLDLEKSSGQAWAALREALGMMRLEGFQS